MALFSLKPRLYFAPDIPRGMLQFLCLIGVSFYFQPAVAQAPVLVSSDRIEPTARQLAILEDVGGKLSIEQVVAAWEKGEFQQGAHLSTNLGTTQSVYWARVVLENPASFHLHRVLTHDYAPTDDVRLFLPADNGKWHSQRAGDAVANSSGNRRVPGFLLELSPASSTQLYLRVNTTSNLNFEISLWSPVEYDRYERNISLTYGLLFGAILATTLYLLFAWFLVRETTALWLATYLLSYGAYLSFLNGFSSNWLLPVLAGSINSLHLASFGFLFGFGALFFRRYLDLEAGNPGLDRIAAFLQWAGFAIVLNPLLPLPVLGLLTVIVAGPGPLFTMGVAFYLWAQRRNQAGVFAIGWTVAHLSSFLGTLRVAGALPNYEVFIHLPAIGCALSFSFFAWAIAQRLSQDRIHAYEDPLTGLANRRRFEEQIGIEFTRACRYARPLALIIIDVDRFKLVNDNHGHSFGDKVLRVLAQHCRDQSRGTDLIARIGGEEFAIVLVETGLEKAASIAERLREVQADTPVEEQTITISLGVSELLPGDEAPSEMQERADKALYRAKNKGRNRVEIEKSGI